MTLSDLSPRERQVAELVADGRTAPQIAKQLGCKPGTVRTHIRRIAEQLRASGQDDGRTAMRAVERWARAA